MPDTPAPADEIERMVEDLLDASAFHHCFKRTSEGTRDRLADAETALLDALRGLRAEHSIALEAMAILREQRNETEDQLEAAESRALALEAQVGEIKDEMPDHCTCDAAWKDRGLSDPDCAFHDYGEHIRDLCAAPSAALERHDAEVREKALRCALENKPVWWRDLGNLSEEKWISRCLATLVRGEP